MDDSVNGFMRRTDFRGDCFHSAFIFKITAVDGRAGEKFFDDSGGIIFLNRKNQLSAFLLQHFGK